MPKRVSGWGLCIDQFAIGLIELQTRRRVAAVRAREKLASDGISLPTGLCSELESALVEKIDAWLKTHEIRDSEQEIWTTERIVRRLVAKNGSLV